MSVKKNTGHFAQIKGVSQYTKTQFDFSFREQWTLDVASVIEDLITNGYSRGTIIKLLCKELSFKQANATTLYNKVESKLYKSGLELKKVMLAKNIVRLEKLYREAVNERNTANCLKVIELLNKTCDLYKNNIEVTQNNFTYQLGFSTTVPDSILIESDENTTEDIEYIEVDTVEESENNEENTGMKHDK